MSNVQDDYNILVQFGQHTFEIKYSSVKSFIHSFASLNLNLTVNHLIIYIYQIRNLLNLPENLTINQIQLIHLGKSYKIVDLVLKTLQSIQLPIYSSIHLVVSPQENHIYKYFNFQNYLKYELVAEKTCKSNNCDETGIKLIPPEERKRRKSLTKFFKKIIQ